MTNPPDRLAEALKGRYRLERELGRGGRATVYLATDLKHERPVALKVLRPELAAALGPDRFLREIRLTAALDHPHVLALLDYDSKTISPGSVPRYLLHGVCVFRRGTGQRSRADIQ